MGYDKDEQIIFWKLKKKQYYCPLVFSRGYMNGMINGLGARWVYFDMEGGCHIRRLGHRVRCGSRLIGYKKLENCVSNFGFYHVIDSHQYPPSWGPNDSVYIWEFGLSMMTF